jgi:hypothetical protein
MSILSSSFAEITDDLLIARNFMSVWCGNPEIKIVNPNLSPNLKCNRIVDYKISQKYWAINMFDKNGYGFIGHILYFPPGFDETYDEYSGAELSGKVYLKIDRYDSRFGDTKWRDLMAVNDIGEIDAAVAYLEKTIEMYCDNYDRQIAEWQRTVMKENLLRAQASMTKAFSYLKNYSNF